MQVWESLQAFLRVLQALPLEENFSLIHRPRPPIETCKEKKHKNTDIRQLYLIFEKIFFAFL